MLARAKNDSSAFSAGSVKTGSPSESLFFIGQLFNSWTLYAFPPAFPDFQIFTLYLIVLIKFLLGGASKKGIYCIYHSDFSEHLLNLIFIEEFLAKILRYKVLGSLLIYERSRNGNTAPYIVNEDH